MKISDIIIEVKQPMNLATALIHQYGGRAMKFRELPETAQKAIIARAREHLDPSERVPRINPNRKFGYVEIPMNALKQAIFKNILENEPDTPFKSFDDYHRWYISHGDTPNHTEIWPIELETRYPELGLIEDGSHRFHSYVQRGLSIVPAIYPL